MNKITRYPFTPILGWSVSRYDKFTSCKRRYFYDYYSKYDREFSRDKIEIFKQMTTIPLETGNIVHDVARDLLQRLVKSNSPLNKEKFFDYAGKMTNDYCQSKTFTEVYYKELDRVPIAEIGAKVKMLLENFVASSRYKWLTEEAIAGKDNWVIEPDGFGETRIEGLKGYCKVDFLFPSGEKLYILDWKTGKPDAVKHTKQLIGYTLWAVNQFEYTCDKICPIIVYLNPAYSETGVEVSEGDIRAFGETVKRETAEMYRFCSNLEENVPLAKENFPLTPNVKFCNYCSYRELCGRG